VTCLYSYSIPHWGNNFAIYAAYLKSKRAFSVQHRKTMKDINLVEQKIFQNYCDTEISTSMVHMIMPLALINHMIQVLHSFQMLSLIVELTLLMLTTDNSLPTHLLLYLRWSK